MRRALRKLLTDVVMHKPYVSVDKEGKPAFGVETKCRARIDENRVVRMRTDGVQHLVSGPTFIADVAVGYQDQITLPDGRTPLVAKSDVVREPNGAISHSEVYFV